MIYVYNVAESNKDYFVLKLTDGSLCKLSKKHMKALYRFLNGYFKAKMELE